MDGTGSYVDEHWKRSLPAPESVRRSFGESAWSGGWELFKKGGVLQVTYKLDFLKARVRNGRVYEPLWGRGGNETLRLSCSCSRAVYCEHQIALYLAAYDRLHPGIFEPSEHAQEGFEAGTVLEDGRWSGTIVPRKIHPGFQGLLSGLFPEESAQQESERRYILTPQLLVSPGLLGLSLRVEGPRIEYEVRSPAKLLPLWRSSCSRGRESADWAPEDQRLLRFLESQRFAYSYYSGKIQFSASEFSLLLPVLQGHPRLRNRYGRLVQISTQPLELIFEGEFQEQRLDLTARLMTAQGYPVRQPLLFLDGKIKWWYDGRAFYPHHQSYSPEQMVAAAEGTRFTVEGMERILPLLQSGRIRMKQGASPPLDQVATEVWLRLGPAQEGITLEAELKTESGLSWPLAPSPAPHRTEEGRYLVYDPVQLRETRRAVMEAGFEAEGPPGRYLLPFQALEGFLEGRLPEWRRQYQVELDPELNALLEGGRSVTPALSTRWKGDLDWFEVSWSLELDGANLPSAEIQAVLKSGGRYHCLRDGRIVAIDRPAIRQQVEELERFGCKPEEPAPQRVHLHFIGRTAQVGGRLTEGLSEIYRKLKDFQGIQPVEPPENLAALLRPYQREGLSYLNFLSEYRFGGILADDMGLGKTVQTLALLELKRRTEGSQPSLVVCPTSVAPNWVEEAAKFTPALQAVHFRSSRELKQARLEEYDLVVLSYALARRNSLDPVFRYLILDEAQNIKNPHSRNARSVKNINARYRLALTGTPIENSATELWSIFDFLMPGFLGGLGSFEKCFGKAAIKNGDRAPLSDLSRQVRPFILRRLKSQVARDLPARMEQNIYCDLTAAQRQVYARLAAAARHEIDEQVRDQGWEKSQIHVLAALTRLRQLCCHPALVDASFKRSRSGKLEAFFEVLESILSGGHRVVVFSQFVQMLKIIERQVKRRKIGYVYLDGKTRDRRKVVRRFQECDDVPLFLMSLKAGGTGINLTAADYVVLFDPWWNPAVENQAIDRAHRIGRERPVTAYRMIARGTLEEKMLELKARKRDLADRVLASESDFLQRLTREDLEILLAAE
ncbi:MAG: DEAD/DEAH box helicase [Acidobacteriota bacterium]